MDAYEISCFVFWVITLFFVPAIAEKIHGDEIDFGDPSAWVAVAMISFLAVFVAVVWIYFLAVLAILFTVVKCHEKFIRPRMKK